MMRCLIRCLCLIIAFLCSTSLLAYDSFQSRIQTVVDHWRVEQQAPAVSLLIALPNKPDSIFLSGTTLKNGTTPITADAVFGVGSITKTFVAATILQLQQEKKLNIDNQIGSYFPEYPRWQHVTIRQLLNMTSGIANFTALKQYKTLVQAEPTAYHAVSLFADMAYQQKDSFLPGAGWQYSNTNYYLLGLLIEKITHHHLTYEFEHRFFIPLHLTHAFYFDNTYPAAVYKQMAHGYLNDKDVTQENPAYFGPGGSMIMNATDIAIWVRALFTPEKVLTLASLQQLMTTVIIPYTPPRPKGSAYGLGLFSVTLPHYGLAWWYTGVVDGYSSLFMWIPSKDIIIVAQVNHWRDSGDNFALLFPNQVFVKNILQLIDKFKIH